MGAKKIESWKLILRDSVNREFRYYEYEKNHHSRKWPADILHMA